jgi:hypothetical protein
MAADPPVSLARVRQQVSPCIGPRQPQANYLSQFWGQCDESWILKNSANTNAGG